MQNEKPAMQVLPERRKVVSSLDQPMSDVYFMEEYGKKARNMGFHSLISSSPSLMRNTLKVVVDRTTVLKEGDNVVLRLLETAKVQGLHIPRQSRLIAVAKIEGNRMHLLIKSIEVDGHIIAVKLSAYDTDGQEGVYIPGSEDINALKEVGANIGGSMGTSFTFASSAKDQIISETARGVMQVRGMGSEHTVFALEQFSLAEDKQLEVTLYERNGGRTLTFYVTAEDLQIAKKIDNLKLKW